MKKIIIIFLIFIAFSSKAFAEDINYDAIYNNLPTIDLYYEQNEDPDEQADSLQYFKSPYPLIRTSFTLSCKTNKFKIGYYLLTPRSKNGYDFIMFKQAGKIVGLVPVTEKRPMTQEEINRVFPPPPKQKHSVLSLPWRGFKFCVKKAFGNYKKPPEPPKYALDANIVDGGKYFEIFLYKEESFTAAKEELVKKHTLYKMLFKIER